MPSACLSPALQEKLSSIYAADVVKVCNLAVNKLILIEKHLLDFLAFFLCSSNEFQPRNGLNLIWSNHSILWKRSGSCDQGRHPGRLPANDDDGEEEEDDSGDNGFEI